MRVLRRARARTAPTGNTDITATVPDLAPPDAIAIDDPKSKRKQRKADEAARTEAEAALAVVAEHADAGLRAQLSGPGIEWSPPRSWATDTSDRPVVEDFAAPSAMLPARPPAPAPTGASAAIDVSGELVRVLEVVTTMCDHVIEYIEADRAERRLLIEALTNLTRSFAEPLAPQPPIEPAPVETATAPAKTERIIGGSVDAGPEPVIDLREPERTVEVRCRFGDRWVDGFEICGVLHGETGVRYRLRRRVDGVVLPELFEAANIRHVETFEELTATPAQQKRWSSL